MHHMAALRKHSTSITNDINDALVHVVQMASAQSATLGVFPCICFYARFLKNLCVRKNLNVNKHWESGK